MVSQTEEVNLQGTAVTHRQPSVARELLAEVAQLRETIAAKDAHINSLETQVWAWRAQASNEARAHKATREMAWDRECELIRVIHTHVLQQQDGDAPGVVQLPSKRRWKFWAS